MSHGSVIGIGYEGADIESFVSRLRLRGVQRVVDVRLNPLSRKKGFSKTRLREALAAADIEYTHLRALGNPKSNRVGFSLTEGEDAAASRAAYAAVLERAEARAALEQIRAFSTVESVALLCFEAADGHCHRELVLKALETRSLLAA